MNIKSARQVAVCASLALMVSACAVTGVGYDGGGGYDDVGVGYVGGVYEPYGYDYGGWGGRYHVGPPRGGYPGGAVHGGGYHGGGGFHGGRGSHGGAPSIPSAPRGGGGHHR